MNFKEDPFKRVVVLIISAIFLFWGLNNYRIVFHFIGLMIGFSFPLLLGGGIAFLLNILLRFIEKGMGHFFGKRKVSGGIRALSILITLILIVAVLSGIMLIVIPQIGETVLSIKEEIPNFLRECQEFLQRVSHRIPSFSVLADSAGVDWATISRNVTSFIGNLGGKALNSSISIATSVFSGFVNFFLAIIFALYILAGKETLSRQMNSLLKAYLPDGKVRKIKEVTALIDKTFSNFFTGQCLEAVILGTLFFVGMTVLKFPYALLISVLIGFTALIPVFGAFIGCGIGAFLILVVNPMQAVWFIVFFLIMQQIEGNLIYPRVVGSSLGLPPIWVFVAVSLGGSMMGVAGMLIFIPTTAVIYTLLKEDVRKHLAAKK